MKFFLALIILFCLVSPCFAQNAAPERFRNLSDAMGRTIDNSSANLENYNQDATDAENMKTFLRYRRKYESLNDALKTSESRMDLLLRTNDKADVIAAERDKYESYLKQLQDTKSEYDSWLRNVR